MDAEELCPTCQGTTVCMACHGGTVRELATCECAGTDRCVDCHGLGTYSAYATEQMSRLRTVLYRNNIIQ